MGFSIEGVPSEVKGAVTEVTHKFSSGDVLLHDSEFKKSNEGNDLGKASTWDGVDGSKSIRDGFEASARGVNVSRLTDSVLGNEELPKNSKHGDTSVLDLDIAETVNGRSLQRGQVD